MAFKSIRSLKSKEMLSVGVICIAIGMGLNFLDNESSGMLGVYAGVIGGGISLIGWINLIIGIIKYFQEKKQSPKADNQSQANNDK